MALQRRPQSGAVMASGGWGHCRGGGPHPGGDIELGDGHQRRGVAPCDQSVIGKAHTRGAEHALLVGHMQSGGARQAADSERRTRTHSHRRR